MIEAVSGGIRIGDDRGDAKTPEIAINDAERDKTAGLSRAD
jgi:hypothetical protein